MGIAVSAFYDDMAATALELLAEFGAPVTLRRVTPGAYDPATSSASSTITDLPTTGLVRDYKASLIDGTRILVGDKECVLSNEQAPKLTDKLPVDGVDWSIVDIKEINPAGTVVCYFVQVRK